MSFLPQADGPLRSLVLYAVLPQLLGAHKTFSSSQISPGCRKLCWGCLGSLCLNIASFSWLDGQEFMYSGLSLRTGNMGFFYLEYFWLSFVFMGSSIIPPLNVGVPHVQFSYLFYSVCTHSLSDLIQSLNFKDHLNKFQIHISNSDLFSKL